jgi:hypothetical protein
MSHSIYYVYTISDPRESQPFYVGMGKNNRAESHLTVSPSKERSNPHRYRKIKQILQAGLVPVIQIAANSFNSKKEAGVYEINLIKQYGRQCDHTGILCNIKPGGIGGKHIAGEDYTSNISVDQYDLCGNYIRTFKSMVDAASSVCDNSGNPSAISQCCHMSGNNKSYKGHFWTLAGKSLDTEWCWSKRKPVYQWGMDGVLIKIHATSSSAAREVGIARSAIGECLHKNIPRAGDFMWSYDNTPPVYNGKRKSVLCVETNQLFKSVGAAARHFGIDHSGLAKVCRDNTNKCKGYTFKYV